MPWFAYILLCDQKTYYIGLTYNLQQRFASHKSKQNVSTKEFSDLKLVYHEKYQTRFEAEKREIQLKKWTRAKKNALIIGNKMLLMALSKTRSLVDGGLRK